MDNGESREYILGIVYAISAYLFWGLSPLYWKLLDQVNAEEILAHRVLWALIFVVLILTVTKKIKSFLRECKVVIRSRKKLIGIILTSLLISANWYAYIWAVNNDRIIEASLGYYINPLVLVLFSIFIMKEKLSFYQMIALTLAFVGVANLTFHFGSLPWAALVMATTFALYGLLKKIANLGSVTALAIETLLVTPIALMFIAFTTHQGTNTFSFSDPILLFLLIGAGIVTSIPLLLFASGAKRIPLSMVGFFQYLAPTITLCIGIFVFDETFTKEHLISFIFIWSALVLYSFAKTKLFIKLEPKFIHKDKSFQG